MKKYKKKLEEMKIGPKKVINYFGKKSLTEKTHFWVVILTRIVTVTIPLIVPFYYKEIINTITSFSGSDKNIVMASLISLIGMILLLEVIHQIGWRITEYSIVKLELRVMKNIFAECFEYLHKHSYRFFTNSFGGALVKKVNKLAYSYEAVFDTLVFNLMDVAIGLSVIMVVMFVQNIYLGLIFGGRIVIYMTLQYFLYKWKLPYDIDANIHDSKITGALSDTITNNFNILTFSSHKRESSFFDTVLMAWKNKTQDAWIKSNIIFAINGILMVIFEITILYVAVKLWGLNLLTAGAIVLLQMYMFRLFSQIFAIGHVFKRLYKSFSESAEMLEILETPHEIQDVKGAENMQIRSGKIEFKDVAFAYNKGQLIFDNLSFKIKPGEKVAFVGESGSGKTSIVKLLLRFFDLEDGKILIDEQDIFKATQDSLRNSISIVPQDPILFHRTLKENIAYGKPDASEEEILAASKMARCHRFIKTLPEGYDTLVGERGIKLSGGERQRVAIARAILENKGILILDEATSALDSESEMLIQEAMASLMRKKTTIIVAHRLSTIMNMDKIIVMDQGKIVEIGTHKELLLNNDGIYKNLWDIQSGGFSG